MEARTGTEWPLTARCAELRAISEAVGRGEGVLLAGDAGVGKTRLMTAVLDLVAAGGSLVRSLVAAPHSGRLPLREIEDLVTDGRAGVVVGIDDAHRFDRAAATELSRLAAAGRVTLVMCARTEAVVGAEVAKLWLDGLVTRTDLAPFDLAAVAEVVAARLGGAVPAEIVGELHAATLGNALLLRELVEHGLADGGLRTVDGRWVWAGLTRVDNRLADLVRLRIGTLDRDERELVNMIVLADCVDADAPPWRSLAHAAESLNERDVLVAESNGHGLRLRLRYPLYGTVLAAAMPEVTKRRLQRRLAGTVAPAGGARWAPVPHAAFEQVEAGDATGALRQVKRECPPLEACDDRTWVAYQTVTAFAALEAGERSDIVVALARLCQHPAHLHRGTDSDTCAVAEFVSGCVDRAEGRLAQSVERLRRAHALAAAPGRGEWPASPAMVLAQLAGALAESGRTEEAAGALTAARSALDPGCPRVAADTDHVDLAAVVVAAHAGDHAGAVRSAEALAGRAAAAGRVGLALGALHVHARAGSAADSARVLRSIPVGPHAGGTALRLRHISALARGDRDALAELATEFARLGWRPLAAEAAAQAQDESHRSGGRRWSGRVAAELANILAGYPRTLPAWVGPPTPPRAEARPVLTPREREIAMYAAEGLTNQEIADRLVISIRTVENHLQRTYTKLGINARSSLTVHVIPH